MEPICATLVGSDLCHARGLTVQHPAPVLAMCRKLVEEGYHPDSRLLAYRGSELAMEVSSIGYGARYTVEEGNRVEPRRIKYKARPFPKGSAPVVPKPQDRAE